MRIFYLDTSSSFLYFSLFDDDKSIFEFKEEMGKDMSKNTLFKIQNYFNEHSISVDSIDKIILVNGPGSFTGIRIGCTIAKTWSWALNIPITTISSLDAMALSSSDYDYIVPIIDARRGYTYATIRDKYNNALLDSTYILLDDLKNKISELNGKVVYISNDDFEFDTIKYSPNFFNIINFYKDKENVNPHLVDALYLKSTEAEEKNGI